MTAVELRAAETMPWNEDPNAYEAIETWVAEWGEAFGVGTTKAGALRSLADDLDRRGEAAVRGEL